MKRGILFLACLFTTVAYAGKQSLYDFSWLDEDDQVYVIQNRKYTKKKKFYAGFSGGPSAGSAFLSQYGVQARIGYFFREDLGLEALFSYNLTSQNDNFDEVRGTSQTIPFYRAINNYAGLMLLWSPWYGKINMFRKVIYFDWILGFGAARISDEHNRSSVETNFEESLTSESHFGLLWKIGMRFYITKYMGFRFDVTPVHYKAEKASGTESRFYSNYDFGFGFDFSF